MTVARKWSAANPGNQAIRRELRDAIFALVPLAPGVRVLDDGCGTGWWLRTLADRGLPDLHGIDRDERRVAAARVAVPEADVRVGDVRALPYGDGAFDAIYLLTVLSSLPSTGEALREALRVLAPGGRLVIWEPRVPTANRATRLVTRRELRAVAGPPDAEVALTLLPPLARRLGRATDRLYEPLARVPALRTHRLVVFSAPGRAASRPPRSA
jgi:ubiquinone/menaquinone biosynthesis C-methylase UbiE